MIITFKPGFGTIYMNSATAVPKIEPISPSGDASARHPEDEEARLLAQNVAHEYNQELFGEDGKIIGAPTEKRLLAIT